MLGFQCRGEWRYLPSLEGNWNGAPTGFWSRCIPHERRYRDTGKVTVAAVMRRFMCSIAAQADGWATGVEGLRRFYRGDCRTKPAEHLLADIPRRTAFNAVTVLIACGMVERRGRRLHATEDFLAGAVPVTPASAAAVPVCLLSGGASAKEKQARQRALHKERMRKYRMSARDSVTVTPSGALGDALACTDGAVGDALACTPLSSSDPDCSLTPCRAQHSPRRSGGKGEGGRTGPGAPLPSQPPPPDPPGCGAPPVKPRLVLIGGQPVNSVLTKKAGGRRTTHRVMGGQ